MVLLELTCLAIVILYLVVRIRRDASPLAFLRRMGLLCAASWIGENTVIHTYHFYQYSPSWHLFVDQVPLQDGPVVQGHEAGTAAHHREHLPQAPGGLLGVAHHLDVVASVVDEAAGEEAASARSYDYS